MPADATVRPKSKASRKKKAAAAIADGGKSRVAQATASRATAPAAKTRQASGKGVRAKSKVLPSAAKKEQTTASKASGPTAPEDRIPALDGELVLAMQRTSSVDRIRHLIVLDAQSVVRRLSAQLGAMIELFSRHRDREPLLAPLRSWIPSADFGQLAELEPEEQRALSQFLEELEALRWYCRYTNDMPNTAQMRLTRFAGQLENAVQKLVSTIRPVAQK